MNKAIAVLIVAAFIGIPLAYAMNDVPIADVVDVGNRFCPVIGGEIDSEHYVVYEGKRYGLCCPKCGKTFLQAPEKYLENVNENAPDADCMATCGSIDEEHKN